MNFKGAIFDLDGVITKTAKQHFKAWKRTFEDFLRENNREPKFDYKKDYIPYVDGKPRYQGVRSFLESRDITLPFGTPLDKPGYKTICAVGNRKNELFRKIILEDGVDVYESTVDFVRKLKENNIKVGVASSSKNCSYVLEKAGLLELFGTVVNGLVSKELGLSGKPDPDIFILAAENIGLSPYECLMVEDAISGVKAGKNGNFGLVVGINREVAAEKLKEEGADIVIGDMSELNLQTVEEWFKIGLEKDSWQLEYRKFEPEKEKLRESLTTVGNGYFGTRGCFACNRADEVIHYPGTYIAGLYNKLATKVYRRKIINNDFVNCPNWLLVKIKIGQDKEFIDPLKQKIISYNHKLNMKDGIVTRHLIFEDQQNRKTKIETCRFAAMSEPHYGALEFNITPLNYSEKIFLHSSLDGDVINFGVPRYRELNSQHLAPITVGKDYGKIYLKTKTVTSEIKIFMEAQHELYWDNKKLSAENKLETSSGVVTDVYKIEAVKGSNYRLKKLVGIFTSLDQEIDDLPETFNKSIVKKLDFEKIKKEHIKKWHYLWKHSDYNIKGDRFIQKAVRLHIYHLYTTANLNNQKIDAGMPARGLHGEAYRGHIFWDELFIYPFYNIHFPQITRALLMYRYRRLDAARQYAKQNGYKGAMYPWQTADDGKEETQEVHYNPMSGTWGPDYSRRQRHVSLAVAYNIWEYFYLTNDLEFLVYYGLEMMLEIARFWASIAYYDEKDGRYHIEGVMGPDEFHEKYPTAKKGGLKDNAYTNIMVSWLLHKIIETYQYRSDEVKKAIAARIGLKNSEIKKWQDIVKKMKVVFNNDIIVQFDGYMGLKELDWQSYKQKYDDIRRMDRILKAEGDTPDRYKVAKQADVLMIFYILSPDQVKHILEYMDYQVKPAEELLKKNYEYYEKRTSHGSTLSYVVHAAILTYLKEHRQQMWQWFQKAMQSDIYDTQGGTTQEGIHTGVMAGSLDIIFKSFAGINIFKDHLHIEPFLPAHWQELKFKMFYKGNWITFKITHQEIHIKINKKKEAKNIYFEIEGEKYDLQQGKTLKIPYQNSYYK
ncbi:MAG: beta-phosphoglucomutase family hydrolase [Candidatus Cloacimonadota bacterium]|nr:beta-phosphoglucomutase family hydrolase [Candidatus Cloacimonadota bacterium]